MVPHANAQVPPSELRGRADECMMALCRLLTTDWPTAFLQVGLANGGKAEGWAKNLTTHSASASTAQHRSYMWPTAFHRKFHRKFHSWAMRVRGRWVGQGVEVGVGASNFATQTQCRSVSGPTALVCKAFWRGGVPCSRWRLAIS